MKAKLLAVAVLLGACAADSQLRDGEGTNTDPRCATPNDGCACPAPGSSTACGLVKQKLGNATLCEQGQRSCGADGTWGVCVGTGAQTYSYVGGGEGLGLQGLGAPVGCGSPCDPACVQYPDTPFGLDAGAGVRVTDAGLAAVGSGGDLSSCTSMTLVPEAGLSLVDSRSTPLPDDTITVDTLPAAGAVQLVDTNGTSQGTTLRFRAVMTPLGCDGFGAEGTKAQWTTDAPNLATMLPESIAAPAGNRGNLQLFGAKGGPLVLTARAGSFSATKTLNVRVVVEENCVAADSVFAGATTAGDISWLYPLENTLFPRGLQPPVVMWKRGSVSNGVARYKFTLEHVNASSQVDFSWSTCRNELSNTPRLTSETDGTRAVDGSTLQARAKDVLSDKAWRAFETTAGGVGAVPGNGIVRIKRKVGATVYQEPDLHVQFSSAKLKGRVYYTRYGRRLTADQGWETLNVYERMVEPASGARLDNVYGNMNFCPTCHSVSGNGKVMISSTRGRTGTRAGGLQYLSKEGGARYGWYMDLTEAQWSAADGAGNTHAICNDTTAKGPRSCQIWGSGFGDARYYDWNDSDLGRAPVGEVAPGHTWENGSDVLRVQGQSPSEMGTWTPGNTDHQYRWRGDNAYSKFPHGRSDSTEGMTGAALSFDGRYALIGNNSRSNTWGFSMSGRTNNRWDNTPWRLVSIGHPVSTDSRWDGFPATDWQGLPSCQSTALGDSATHWSTSLYQPQRFMCDTTPTSGWSLAAAPLLTPQFGTVAPSGATRLAAIVGGDPPDAPWVRADGSALPTSSLHHLVVYDVAPAAQTHTELVPGSNSVVNYSMPDAPQFSSPRIVATDAARSFSSPTFEPGNEAVVAQACSGTFCAQGPRMCVKETTPGVFTRQWDHMACPGKAKAFDAGDDYKRYRESAGPFWAAKSCMSDARADFPDDRAKRATPCKGATDQFRDRESNPLRAVCQRAAAATYTVEVCRGAANAGVTVAEDGSHNYYAYANTGLCGGVADRRLSVCNPGDTYLGLRPDGSGVARYTCQVADRYQVVQCNFQDGARTAATYANAAGWGQTECATPRATVCEGAADTNLGSAEGEPMSYCLRDDGNADPFDNARYRVNVCPTATANKWATYPCDVLPPFGIDFAPDCWAEGGYDVGGTGPDMTGFGLPQSTLVRTANSGGVWSMSELDNLRAGESSLQTRSYSPSMFPGRSGGFRWLLYASSRRFGNAFTNDWNSTEPLLGLNNEASLCTNGAHPNKPNEQFLQTLIWMSAMNDTDAPGDTSHAPFLLPGQAFGMQCDPTTLAQVWHAADGTHPTEWYTNVAQEKHSATLHEKPVWVQDACSTTALTCGAAGPDSECQDDSDCCDAASGTSVCQLDIPATTGLAHCRPKKAAASVATGGTCFADGDCSGGALCSAACTCLAVPCAPEYLSAQTFDRVFTASCKTGQTVEWTQIGWDASAGANSSVQFYVQTADTEAALTAADGTNIGTVASTSPATGNYAVPVAGSTKPVLRLRLRLNPSTAPDRCTSPLIRAWSASFTCRDAE